MDIGVPDFQTKPPNHECRLVNGVNVENCCEILKCFGKLQGIFGILVNVDKWAIECNSGIVIVWAFRGRPLGGLFGSPSARCKDGSWWRKCNLASDCVPCPRPLSLSHSLNEYSIEFPWWFGIQDPPKQKKTWFLIYWWLLHCCSVRTVPKNGLLLISLSLPATSNENQDLFLFISHDDCVLRGFQPPDFSPQIVWFQGDSHWSFFTAEAEAEACHYPLVN